MEAQEGPPVEAADVDAEAYLFTHDHAVEATRIGALELTLDPATLESLRERGVGPGWRCLDVGAGAGSVSRWLVETVGSSGEFVSIDLDTSLLTRTAEAGARVVQHDIVAEPFSRADFDLVHARLLLEWLPDREVALRHMADSLKPGGVLVIEDLDWPSQIAPPAQLGGASAAVSSVLAARGYELDCGRHLAARLEALGLEDVGARSRVSRARGGGSAAVWWAGSIERVRQQIVAGGTSDEDVQVWIEALSDPSVAFWLPPSIVAWGRSPLNA